MGGIAMPVTLLGFGQEGRVEKVTGRDNVQRLLMSMGFVAGEKVSVISRNGCNYILGVRGTRVALDRAMASRIRII